MPTSCGHGEPGGEHRLLEGGDVGLGERLALGGRHRVLPQLRLRDRRSEVAAHRAHVAVEELVPGLGEGQPELLGVLVEAPRDLLVLGVEAQREVGGEHGRRARERAVLGVGDGVRPGTVLRLPLVGTGRALGQLPLEPEEVVEELVRPLGRLLAPGDLGAAGDRVAALAGAVLALPAQAHRVHRAGLGLRADEVRVAGAVGLAEGVAAGDERHRLLVVHRHPAERLADVAGRLDRVGLAVGALGVDVDQAHLDRAERVGQLPVTAVPLVAEPGVLGAPVDLLRLPDVLAPEAEAEGLEAHVLERHVAGEDEQVGPGDLLAVLLLDRPEQPAGLVEVGVVRPAVERGEALLALAAATAAVLDPVGARGVPAHPDEQRAVVPEVGRPPVLGGVHDLDEVGLEGLDVEPGEVLLVGEPGTDRAGLGRVRVQDRQVDLVGPPVLDGPGPPRRRRGWGCRWRGSRSRCPAA